MSNSAEVKIRISRSKYIEKSREIAILRLNMAQHLIGQPIMVRYYIDENQTETDTIFAIGIKNGTGEDCYKVISLGGLNLINDVVYELPDVSSLVHGELYLYKDKDDNDKWKYVYSIDNERQLEEITGGPYVFVNIRDKYRWFYNEGILKREDDFYGKEEISVIIKDLTDDVIKRIEAIESEQIKQNEWLLELDKEVFPLTLTFRNTSGNLFLTGTTQNIQFNVQVIRKGEDITNTCTFTLNGDDITLDENKNYIKEGVSTTTTFTLDATYSTLNITKSATNTVTFGYNFYFGVIPANGWEINSENIKNLGNTKLQSKTSTTFITNLSLQKIAFSSPVIYGEIKHIYDANNFDYINDYTRSTVNIDGYDYYVYVKNSEVTVTNFKQQFTY